MSTARIYTRNLAINWIGNGANLVVMFFLSPFVIHSLGLVAYGLWGTLNVLVGYLGVLDLGIRASTGRYIILYIGRGDHKAVDETIRTSLSFFSVIGAGFIVVGTLLGWTFPSLFQKAPPEYHTLLLLLLPIMGASMWVSMYGSVLSSLLTAHDRFDLARGLGLLVLAVRTIATVVALSLGYGIAGLVVVNLGCSVINLLGTYYAAKYVYPTLRIWPFALVRSRLRALFGYGIATAISGVATRIIGQTDVLIVSACIGFASTGIYTAGASLLYYSHTLLGQISFTFFPSLQRAVARGEMGSARWLFFRQVRLAAICGLPLFIGFITFGQRFLHLWLYDPQKFPQEAIEQAAMVMAILAASKLLYVFQWGAGSLVVAMGHIRFTTGLAVTQAILNLGLSLYFVLVLNWGLAGVAMGTLVARLLTDTFALPWYVCRKVKLSLRNFVVQIVGPVVLAGCIFAGICLLVQRFLPGDSWIVFWLQVGLALVCYLPVAMAILVPKSDRKRILGKLKLVGSGNRAPSEGDPTQSHM
jgi:O-antigen/teichoic acid export membrane protein